MRASLAHVQQEAFTERIELTRSVSGLAARELTNEQRTVFWEIDRLAAVLRPNICGFGVVRAAAYPGERPPAEVLEFRPCAVGEHRAHSSYLRRSPRMTDDFEALDAYSSAVVRVVERVLPSVASLRVKTRRGDGAGSASVLTTDGFLLTSAHVVEGADSAEAAFSDGTVVGADVIGRDPLSDLAVLRARGAVPPPVELGDAARLRVGQLVVALGLSLIHI